MFGLRCLARPACDVYPRIMTGAAGTSQGEIETLHTVSSDFPERQIRRSALQQRCGTQRSAECVREILKR